MNYEIVEISETNKHFHNKCNESFDVFGRLEISFSQSEWHHREVIFDLPYTKAYSADEIDLSAYLADPKRAIFFAVSEGTVLGQIAMKSYWNRYCYLEDIGVAKAERQKGVASALIARAEEWARSNNLKGFMLETQDINLAACRLYMRNGFVLGGVDTLLYNNFESKSEQALFWYKGFCE